MINKNWKKELSPEKYHILRERGTEIPFTGKLLKNNKKGVYKCGACGNKIFSSDTKYDSKTGWPSFFKPMKNATTTKTDTKLFMKRTEVICSKCKSHLGHVFNDGPKPSKKRFCINSLALDFKDEK